MPDEKSIDESAGKIRRRGLVTAMAGLGAAALLKLSGAKAVRAADGGPVIMGALNAQESQTSISMADNVENLSMLLVTRASLQVANRDAVQGMAFSGNSAGVRGVLSGGSLGAGVVGQAINSTGTGVVGVASGGTSITQPGGSAGVGVFGMANGARTAIKGEALNGYAVWGASDGAAGVLGTTVGAYAVQGASNANGIGGVFSSVNGVGARGTSTSFVGLVGVSTSNIGVYATTSAAASPALYAENSGGGPAAQFFGAVTVNGPFTVFGGPKAALVTMRDGSLGMMYCQEAPEPYFEDFGDGQLIGGVAQVGIESEFAFLVHSDAYRVFLTALGDCRGLYVSRRGANGFEVRELSGGQSNVAFTYRIVAKRRDIPGRRLERQGNQAVAASKAALTLPPINLPSGDYGRVSITRR
jgi:hypothetical protein